MEEIDDKVIISPEYLYLTIPAEWVCVYHKLLVYMADFGKKIVDDCTASCKGNGKNIISCWNLFQSAIACRELGKNKEADFFISYIEQQLDYIYNGTDKDIFNGTNYYKISDDGKLKALCSCTNNDVKFYVDIKTGELFEEYLNSGKDTANFSIQDGDLIVIDNNKV